MRRFSVEPFFFGTTIPWKSNFSRSYGGWQSPRYEKNTRKGFGRLGCIGDLRIYDTKPQQVISEACTITKHRH